MLDRKETKMLSTQRKSTGPLAGIVSVAMPVVFAATGALSASADGGQTPQSAGNKQFAVSIWHRHTASRNFRYFGYAAPGSVLIPDNSVPDDGCDLPSTGCPYYLANQMNHGRLDSLPVPHTHGARHLPGRASLKS